MVWGEEFEEPAETITVCQRDWAARWKHAEFRRQVTQEGFRLVLLAATPWRAAALSAEIKKSRWPECVSLVVETLPELLLLAEPA